jgi:NAD(P)-dependent dehydrogenase (short-subunit alcohol dehydrogenase family)
MAALEGRTAIVSGAARGLGLAFAHALASRGARVVAFDAAIAIEAVAEDLARATGSEVIGLVADVSRRADVERVVQCATQHETRIDVLVNNAGVWRATPVDSDWQTAVADWDDLMDTNLKGVLMLSRASIPHMLGRANANIVNVSTNDVLPARDAGTNLPTTDLYAASKWALNGFTDAWSAYLEPYGIRVNALCADAALQPERVAQLMLALIHEGAHGRTGENIGAWLDMPVELPPRRALHERITGINVRVDRGPA